MTRRRLLVTVAVVLLATLVVSATAIWLALPRLARWAVVWQVEAQTGRKLTMDAFELDVRGGRLRIAGLRLAAIAVQLVADSVVAFIQSKSAPI